MNMNNIEYKKGPAFMIECGDERVPTRFSDNANLLEVCIGLGASKDMLDKYGTSAFCLESEMYGITMLGSNVTLFHVMNNLVGHA